MAKQHSSSTMDVTNGEKSLQEIRNNSVKRGDAPLHLAVRAGSLTQVRNILLDFQNGVWKESIWKKNGSGETALFIAAENGHVEIVHEILNIAEMHLASCNADNSLDAFHAAAKLGHAGVLKELLHFSPELIATTNSLSATALYTAAAQGHADVVNLLLETDQIDARIARNNGKNALHIAARMGHLHIVKSLIAKDPALGLSTDRKGQTALHMAVKGKNVMVVQELLNNIPSVINTVENKGNTPLHTATRKGRSQIIQVLLSFPEIDIGASNKAGETALQIAEKYFNEEIASILRDAERGIEKKEEHPKPPSTPNKLKQTMSFIKQEIQFHLRRSRRTQLKVHELKRKVQRMNFSGLNNAIYSVNVVATLIASVAFAAIFQVPGQYTDSDGGGYSKGQAYISTSPAFIIFLISDSLALFISLAVVVVQMSLVVIDQKAMRMMVFVINKLMWVSCISISVSFISLAYVVVGQDNGWLVWSTMVIAASILLSTLGIMSYCIVTHRMERKKIKKSIEKAVSEVGASYARCRSLVSESLLRAECRKRMYAI